MMGWGKESPDDARKSCQDSAGSFTRPDLAIPCRTMLRTVPAPQQSPTPFRQAAPG